MAPACIPALMPMCPSQEILGARARFPKPTEAYQLLAAFGSNILVTEGDVWKRQRKIAAPAFSEVSALVIQYFTYCTGMYVRMHERMRIRAVVLVRGWLVVRDPMGILH